MKRILLSVPHMSGAEQAYVEEAFTSNWVSTAGPNLAAFERAFSERLGMPCVALASGTAAIHLGLKLLGVGAGDEVICPTLTFAASANPIRFLGAEPVFVDSERRTWNMDANLLAQVLEHKAARNKLPRAVVVVHLFGQCAEMDPIMEIAGRYGVPVLEDAAEALGAGYRGRQSGTFGEIAAFSFNGNKIITTSGGGMLAARDTSRVEKARYWSTQARDPHPLGAYEHSELGYNYRMSNVLAGIGRGQLEVLDLRVEQRRAIAERYRDAFRDLPGIEAMPEARDSFSTKWLSCFLIDEEKFGASRDVVIRALDQRAVESRPVWKPMHLQKIFSGCETFGGAVAEDLFRRGICLPSSSSLTADEQARVIEGVRASCGVAAC
ncbi:MAG TPA: aminotransferase class I/II-fold pyridoxal phosphate-dependent enzyme [Bryobacteraceae bacterium]|nr:aminotransferase class I/II-fold pyridoxal phosphate-dependent enzyme [Bryobacteraceae bacterium]